MDTQEQRNLFGAWSAENDVMCDWRSRFDVLRDEFPKCKTREEAEELLGREGFLSRYPKLPDWLPSKNDA